jgi:hypothetical protein
MAGKTPHAIETLNPPAGTAFVFVPAITAALTFGAGRPAQTFFVRKTVPFFGFHRLYAPFFSLIVKRSVSAVFA